MFKNRYTNLREHLNKRMSQTTLFVDCPVCSQSFVNWTINQHIEECLLRMDDKTLNKEGNKNTTSSVKLCKSPEMAQNRTKLKSFSNGSKPSKSQESVGNKKNKPSFFASPPLKRARVDNIKSQAKQNDENGLQMQSMMSSKQNTPQEVNEAKGKARFLPLAEKLRPQTLQEYVGQTQILGDKSMLKKLLEADEIPSMIFWGPPGCGKVIYIPMLCEGRMGKGSDWILNTKLQGTGGGGGGEEAQHSLSHRELEFFPMLLWEALMVHAAFSHLTQVW